MRDVQHYARQLRAQASSATVNDFVRVDLDAARKIADALSRLADTETRAVRMEAALRDVRHEIATQGLADTCGTYDRGVIARIDAALTTDGLALTGDAP